MKQRKHWTISALKDFELCPSKYQMSYLFDAADWAALGYRVVPATGSPAMQRGTDIHQTCEDYLKGTGKLHLEISPAWQSLIGYLKNWDAVPEEQWEFEEGWHGREAGALWLRMKIDAHYFTSKHVMHVIDFKTGKPYPANMEQVEVYAIGGFSKFDDVDVIIGELWYFDSDEPHEKIFHRSQAPKLARKWEQRATSLLEATAYPPRPNHLCGWCPYNKDKGGPCAAGSRD
jgi:hypothetical protein